jgi:hypothetical protein
MFLQILLVSTKLHGVTCQETFFPAYSRMSHYNRNERAAGARHRAVRNELTWTSEWNELVDAVTRELVTHSAWRLIQAWTSGTWNSSFSFQQTRKRHFMTVFGNASRTCSAPKQEGRSAHEEAGSFIKRRFKMQFLHHSSVWVRNLVSWH